MARVTSNKTRQFIFVANEPFEAGFEPERMALFMPDGRPIDLTFDGTRMRWAGEWDTTKGYVKNDVVIDGGDMFILTSDIVVAGDISPSLEHAPKPDTVTAPGAAGAAGAGDTASFLDEDRVFPAVPARALGYFDLAVGGTVTITDSDRPNEYLKLYNAAGAEIAHNFPPAFGSAIVKDLPAGRYFLYDEEAILSSPPPAHIHIVLSNGASFNAPFAWEILFRSVSLVEINDDLVGIHETLTGVDATLVGIDGRLDAIEAAPPPPAPHWEGVWNAAIAYTKLAIVRFANALWFSAGGALVGSEPGAVLETEVASPGADAPVGTYLRIGEGANPDVPWDGTGALVFFDLVIGGKISVGSTIPSQWNHLYNSAGVQLGTGAGLGPPVIRSGLAAGRYYVRSEPGLGGSGTTTVTLTASEGASAPGTAPWELMLQGV